MQNLLTLTSLLFSCYVLTRILNLTDIKDMVLASFCFAVGSVSVWGYTLSVFDVLGQLSAWMTISLLTLLLLLFVARVRGTKLSLQPFLLAVRTAVREVVDAIKSQTFFVKSVLVLLAIFSMAAGILNLLLVVFVPPHSWDGIASHLPRMAQFIKNNNLDSFYSPNWGQVAHPKIFTLLFLYSYLVFGNKENMTQFVQYVSYWIFVASVYGISRKMGAPLVQSLFAALTASLLISGVSQANNNLNDMIITAMFGTVVYFLFTFRESENFKYLVLASLGIGLAVGVKASALSVIPSIALVALVTMWLRGNWWKWIKNLMVFQAAVMATILVFAVPSGYVENYRVFGSFLGDREVREVHSFIDKPLDYTIKGSVYNLLRYGLNFISLDGLPPVEPVLKMQEALHFMPLKLLALTNINLENPIAITYFPYVNERPPSFTESGYWGILGFGMLWLSVAWSLLSPRKNPEKFVMALGAVVFLLGVAFSGPYDSSRGRYFSICVIFAAPLVTSWVNDRRRFVQLYLTVILLLGGVSAVSAVVLKTMPRAPGQANLLQMDRLGQLTFFNVDYYRPMIRFEDRVPKYAVVAVYFFPNTFEYPLYGRYLTRRIIPINSFYAGRQPVPEEAEYLLYANGYPCALPDDIYLGADWFLRKLDDGNRACNPTP